MNTDTLNQDGATPISNNDLMNLFLDEEWNNVYWRAVDEGKISWTGSCLAAAAKAAEWAVNRDRSQRQAEKEPSIHELLAEYLKLANLSLVLNHLEIFADGSGGILTEEHGNLKHILSFKSEEEMRSRLTREINTLKALAENKAVEAEKIFPEVVDMMVEIKKEHPGLSILNLFKAILERI
jgi:hypothetical protein